MDKKAELFKTMRTAFLTLYPRIFTDIKNATEMFARAVRLSVEYGFRFQQDLFVEQMCVELEARHKALNALINNHLDGDSLIIELAAGLSPRRTEYEAVPYYELDLPQIIEIKKRIYFDINMINSYLFAVNFLDVNTLRDILLHIVEHSGGRKILLVSEGLFWYLKKADIQGMINVFKEVLKGSKWMWLTSDCFAKTVDEPDYRRVIAKSSNRKSTEPFADFNDLFVFFAQNGFSLERFQITDLIRIEDVFSGVFFELTKDTVKSRILSYTDLACLSLRTYP